MNRSNAAGRRQRLDCLQVGGNRMRRHLAEKLVTQDDFVFEGARVSPALDREYQILASLYTCPLEGPDVAAARQAGDGRD